MTRIDIFRRGFLTRFFTYLLILFAKILKSGANQTRAPIVFRLYYDENDVLDNITKFRGKFRFFLPRRNLKIIDRLSKTNIHPSTVAVHPRTREYIGTASLLRVCDSNRRRWLNDFGRLVRPVIGHDISIIRTILMK